MKQNMCSGPWWVRVLLLALALLKSEGAKQEDMSKMQKLEWALGTRACDWLQLYRTELLGGWITDRGKERGGKTNLQQTRSHATCAAQPWPSWPASPSPHVYRLPSEVMAAVQLSEAHTWSSRQGGHWRGHSAWARIRFHVTAT